MTPDSVMLGRFMAVKAERQAIAPPVVDRSESTRAGGTPKVSALAQVAPYTPTHFSQILENMNA